MPRMTIPQIETQIRAVKRKLAYEKRHAAKLATLATLRAELATVQASTREKPAPFCAAMWGEVGCDCPECR